MIRFQLFFFLFYFVIMMRGNSQDKVFTLNKFSQLTYDPSAAALDNYSGLSLYKRAIRISPGNELTDETLNSDLPLVKKSSGRRWGGLGINVHRKNAGKSGMLTSQTVGLALAYNLKTANDQWISFGIQPAYTYNKTSLQSLTTGSQWLAREFRFDPDAPIGEPFTENRKGFINFNSSATYYITTPDGEIKACFSLAAFNLNQPDNSFFQNESRIRREYLLNTGMVLYHDSYFRLTPQFIYLYNHRHLYSLQLSNKFMFLNENPYDIIQSGHVEIIASSDFRNKAALGISIYQPRFAFGISYQIPTSGRDQSYFNNGIEFGIKIFTPRQKSKVSRATVQESASPLKREIKFNTASPMENRTETQIIQQNLEQYSKVSSVQFELDKHFEFEFGRTELSEDAKHFLNELFQLLQSNPEYKMEIVGHTDNVGKAGVNHKLSAARAQEVAGYLINLGLEKERIRSRGAGDTAPVAPNDTEENRSRNRRVQFIIYVNR